jgi:hypothetical protein
MRGKGKSTKLFELLALVGIRTDCIPVENQNLIGQIAVTRLAGFVDFMIC